MLTVTLSQMEGTLAYWYHGDNVKNKSTTPRLRAKIALFQELLHGTDLTRFDRELYWMLLDDPEFKGLLTEPDEAEGHQVFARFHWDDHYKGAPPPLEIPLAEKARHMVWSDDKFGVIKLPADSAWLQREGFDMNHCLMIFHEGYAQQQENGDIMLFSMIELTTGKPVVDIEVALRQDFNRRRVDSAQVTQVRGDANACPPDDIYVPSLMEFFQTYGKDWELASKLHNFDGCSDGKRLIARAQLLHLEQAQTADAPA